MIEYPTKRHVGQASTAPISGASAMGSAPLLSVPYEHFVKRAESLLEQQIERVRNDGGAITQAYSVYQNKLASIPPQPGLKRASCVRLLWFTSDHHITEVAELNCTIL